MVAHRAAADTSTAALEAAPGATPGAVLSAEGGTTTRRTGGTSTGATLAALLATLLLCTACATPQPIARARAELRGGNADAALATLSEAEVPRRDRLLLLLDRGLAAQAAGRYRESTEALAEADALVERLDYVSVRDQGASLLVSDRVSSYRGESAERLWIHTFQMINFLALGETEGAAVEARRAVRELEEHGDTFAADPVTRLLAAMSFEAAGQVDGAGVEYRRLVGEDESEALDGMPDGVLRAAWLNARRTARPDVATRLAAAMSEEDRIAAARRTLESREGRARRAAGRRVRAAQARRRPVRLDRAPHRLPLLSGTVTPTPPPAPEVRVDGERIRAVSVSTRLVDVARAPRSRRTRQAHRGATGAARAAAKYKHRARGGVARSLRRRAAPRPVLRARTGRHSELGIAAGHALARARYRFRPAPTMST